VVPKYVNVPFPSTYEPGTQALPSFPLQPIQPTSRRHYSISSCPKSQPCATMTSTTLLFHVPQGPSCALHPPPALCLLPTPRVCKELQGKSNTTSCTSIVGWMQLFKPFRSVDHIWLQLVLQTDPGIQAQLPTTSRMYEKGHCLPSPSHPLLALTLGRGLHKHATCPCFVPMQATFTVCVDEESRGGRRKLPVEYHKLVSTQ